MAVEFRFPDVGEGIHEGELRKWLVKVGDAVRVDQPIAEVETDKAVVELPSPAAGTVLALKHKEGDTIKVGEVLLVIGQSGEVVADVPAPQLPSLLPAKAPQKAAPAQTAFAAPGTQSTTSVVGVLQEATGPALPAPAAKPSAGPMQAHHFLATPATRRIARDLHIDLATIAGTGAEGRVTEEDVRKAAAGSGAKPTAVLQWKEEAHAAAAAGVPVVQKKYDLFGYIDHVPLKGVRKATAQHMVESFYTAVHVTHMDEADVTELVALREETKAAMEAQGVKLTYLPFIVKAVVAMLKKHPFLNASMDVAHEEIVLKKYYSIGIAVDAGDGLLVPVVKNAQNKAIPAIAKEVQELAAKAREKRLDLMDMKGGTFTVTNVGIIGGTHATPVINYPEAAILALGKIQDKAVVRDGKVVVRKILPLSLTFDHRILDGAEAARAMNDLIALLQEPARLLVEE